METRLSGWWLSWGGCALLLLACLAVEHGPKCGVDQYEQHERCCKKCPPGQKVETECSGESDTVCQDCESGRFQAGWTKAMQCTPHADCHQYAGLVVHMGGNAQRNVVCRCRNGTHCYGQECESCQPNSACGPGEGVRQEANHVNDTVCVECADGFFSNVSSATARCQAWSSCEEKNLIQKTKGTRTSDVFCSEEARRTHSLALLLLLLLPLAVLVVGAAVFALRKRRDMGQAAG
ncbi:tumor necrosis factor receptor superfamily member 5 isoform X4 [Elgaria multicarinata webbii]|uniref:tumor necrosis factor receptor superfamily member 5 isoform X4 n=1 Tax=Elgaria multicarinata webbii TaxID=159646 RepID=UPI002FCCFC4D